MSVAVIVAVHLIRANDSKPELVLIIIAMLIGTVWDSGLMMAGLFEFSNGVVVPAVIPLWLVAMWALFATTLNVSMKWMKGKYLIAAIIGAIGGPLAYYAGHRLGAVEFTDAATVLPLIAVGWSIIMPALMALSDRFNGYKDSNYNPTKVEPV